MSRRIRLKDLAETLGVSVSTVGRALADKPEIGSALRARVQRLAKEKGYVAHSAARAMRTGHSKQLGLIVPDVRNDFFGSAAMALASCSEAEGFQLVLAASRDDPEVELRQVRGLVESRIAGIVATLSPNPRAETLALLASVPAIELIRGVAGSRRPWLGIDDHGGLKLAAQHLIGIGHSRIAYIGGSEALSTGRHRLAGYRDAFLAGGRAVPEDLIRLGPPDAVFGASAMEELLALADPPTGVVAAGSELTVGMLDAIGAARVTVPASISVVGFGDAPWFRWWGPGLTTIALPIYDMALACGDLMMRMIAEYHQSRNTSSADPIRLMHMPSLEERGSTAPLFPKIN